jgi:cytochrome c553
MNVILRRIALGLGALVALVVVAAVGLYIVSQRHIDERLTVAGHPVSVPTDSLSIARGQHIATAISKCAECHGRNLAGTKFIDVPPVGTLYAKNLTRGRGGIGAAMSDLDWERAIRHGVAPDGRKLLFMPSEEFHHMNDDDFTALVAYLKSVPPVDQEWPASKVGPVGRALYLKGDLPLLPAEAIDHQVAHAKAVPPGATLEYGKYVVSVGGCQSCHGPTLSGGHIPGTPPEWKPAANLTPAGIGKYTEEDFFRALREGKRPGGTMLDTVYMPVRWTRLMTDDETRAVFMFLKTVPPKEYGGR